MSQPTISVVINTNGRRASLENTIGSLRQLNYQRFEIIVICGPIQDGTKAYVDSLGEVVRRADCLEHNLSKSRNIGIDLADGELVAFIDDDALAHPLWLEDLASAFTEDDIGAAGGFVLNHTGYEFQYKYATADRLGNSDWRRSTSAEGYNFPLSNTFPYTQGTNTCFRRDALVNIGGFDEEIEFYLDETDLCCRLNDAGFKIIQLNRAIVYHKFLPSSIRNEHKVTKNRYSVLKNKIYFSIVNNKGHHKIAEIIEDAQKFISEHEQDVIHHFKGGRLTGEDVQRFYSDVEQAWARALSIGFSGKRKTRNSFRPRNYRRKFKASGASGTGKTICLLTQEFPPARFGGIGTYTKNAAEQLAAAGNWVRVLTPTTEHNTVDYENGVWVHRIAVKEMPRSNIRGIESKIPDHIWNYSATMAEELHRIDLDTPIAVVEAPIWDCEGIAPLAEGVFPTVLSLHTSLGPWLQSNRDKLDDPNYMSQFGEPMLQLEKFMFINSDAIHANSQAVVQKMEHTYNFKFDAGKTQVIHHGIGQPAGGVSNARGICKLLFVGRLEPRKGIDILAKALLELEQDTSIRDKFEVEIIGDGEIEWSPGISGRHFFQKMLSPLNFVKVHIRGRLEQAELDAAFWATDAVLVPSRYESFGLTAIESFARGKPVIAASAGGLEEVVNNMYNGLLVPTEDHMALATAIKKMVIDKKLRSTLSVGALESFESKFSRTVMCRGMTRLFESVYRKPIPESEIKFKEPPKKVELWTSAFGNLIDHGNCLELDVQGPATIYFTFWKHPWSGVANVFVNEIPVDEFDLFSEQACLRTERVQVKMGICRIRVSSTERRNQQSQGTEVILYRLSVREPTA